MLSPKQLTRKECAPLYGTKPYHMCLRQSERLVCFASDHSNQPGSCSSADKKIHPKAAGSMFPPLSANQQKVASLPSFWTKCSEVRGQTNLCVAAYLLSGQALALFDSNIQSCSLSDSVQLHEHDAPQWGERILKIGLQANLQTTNMQNSCKSARDDRSCQLSPVK